ncbi:unnamed protein product [Schistosoma margrebowiei]|uniref:Uncharacterized protein n=1 Tax=Schistosoma margrebowiei TaxID=48269 RepID=A0A183LFK6_9TREM|nr:unnamed protein product [Schistosoma margrebowiei]
MSGALTGFQTNGYESLAPETNESSSDNRNKNYVFDIPPPPIPPTEMYSPYSKATAGGGNESVLALERRQAELEARAAELDRREKEQQARVNTIHSGPINGLIESLYIDLNDYATSAQLDKIIWTHRKVLEVIRVSVIVDNIRRIYNMIREEKNNFTQ